MYQEMLGRDVLLIAKSGKGTRLRQRGQCSRDQDRLGLGREAMSGQKFMLGCTYIALQRRDSDVSFFAPILGLKHHQRLTSALSMGA